MMATEMPVNSVESLEEQIAALHSMLPPTGAAQALNSMLPYEMSLSPVTPASLQALMPPFPPCKGLSSKPLRWNITETDLQLLEAAFEMDNFPSAFARQQLANELNVSTRQIQVWFQNRRQRSRDKMREGDGADTGPGVEGKASGSPALTQPPSLSDLSELLAKCEKVANTMDKPAKSEGDARGNLQREPDSAFTQSSLVFASKRNDSPVSPVLASSAGSPGSAAPGSPAAAPEKPPPPLVSIDGGTPDDTNSDKDKVSVGTKRNRRGKTKSEARPPGPLDILMSQRQRVQMQTQAQLQAQSKALAQMVQQFMATGGAPPSSPSAPTPAPSPPFYQLAQPMPQPLPPLPQPPPPVAHPPQPLSQTALDTTGVAPASLASLAGLLMPHLQGASPSAFQKVAVTPTSVPPPPPPKQLPPDPRSTASQPDLMALAGALSNLAQLAMGVAKAQAPTPTPAAAAQAPPPAAAFFNGPSFGTAAPNTINLQGVPATEKLVPLHAFNEKLLGLDRTGLLPKGHVPASRSSSVTAETASLGDDDHIYPQKSTVIGLSGLGALPASEKSLGHVDDDDQTDGDLLHELSELVWGESSKRPCY